MTFYRKLDLESNDEEGALDSALYDVEDDWDNDYDADM